jgi:hypothetical protein
MGNANRHELYEMICQGSNIIAIRKKWEKYFRVAKPENEDAKHTCIDHGLVHKYVLGIELISYPLHKYCKIRQSQGT